MSTRSHHRRTWAAGSGEAAGHAHLVFRVADEKYALPLLAVKEIVRPETLAPAPHAPPILRGVLGLRGEEVPVLDLAIAFGGSVRPDTSETCLLIAEAGRDGPGVPLGLVVDAASEVVDLTPAEIAPAPRLGSLVDVEFIAAMARVEQRLVPILDLGRLLASEEVRAALRAARPPDPPRRAVVDPAPVAAADPAAVPPPAEPRPAAGARSGKRPRQRRGAAR